MLRWKHLPAAFVLLAMMGPLARGDVKPFLDQFCIRCHGEKKAEGKLVLHLLSEADARKHLDKWKGMLEKIEIGEMPPEDAKQPTVEQRLLAIQAIKSVLRGAGETIDENRWLAPSRGNWVDHDALFSGKPVEPAATKARLWRLTGQAYEEFFLKKNLQFKLGIKTYGPTRIQSPWNFTPQRDFRDYSASHTIGEAEIEYHMRNATQLAQAMIKKFAFSKPSDGDWGKELNVLLTSGGNATPEQMKAATIASFQLILEREPSAKELERFGGFLAGNLKPLGVEKAVEQFLIAMLFRPEVTYRVEVANGASREMIPPRDLARALSFALTDRVPDEALLKSATDGKLATRDEVRAQIERILTDRGLEKPRILRFFQEYFGHGGAVEIFKDEVTLNAYGFKGRNYWNPNYFVSDTDRLIEWVLAQDKNVLTELLTTSKTFALTMDPKGRDKAGEGTRKAKGTDKPFQGAERQTLTIYETPLKSRLDWSDERPFDMPTEHRMGILTHPSWLVAQSGNFDNNAIHRGRWIREKLLGGKIPDVPITVNAMLPDEPHRTLRDRMAVTREEYCWKCHQHMDPLGMPFEQFDHLGQFRTQEMVVDVEATNDKDNLRDGKPRRMIHKTVALDTTGNVQTSGDAKLDGPVKDPFELIRKLAASERVQQVFVRHAFRFFVGRNETLEDGPTIVAAYQAYKNNGGSMNALITSLLTSDAFLYRTSAKPESKGTSP